MTLPELCVRRPVFTTMLILMPVVLGLMGFMSMGVDLFPNVEIPVVTVTTARQGASVEEMETGVTKKIEEQINTIAGVDELQSSSREGMSMVTVRFLLDKDRDVAQQEVTSKINAIVSQLPAGTATPIIDKFDIDAAPVMSIAVSSSSARSLKEVTEIADKRISQMLSSLPGVGNVTMAGGQKRAIQITLDTDKLQSYHLGVNDVWQALQNQNLEIPGGRVDQTSREVTLRTMGRIVDPREFENVIVANIGDPKLPRQIRLKDVGTAEDSFEEQRGLSLLDGKTTVQLIVQKQSGTNTVEVIDNVKKRMDELKTALDAGGYSDISMQVVRDQGVFIKASIHEVQKHLLIGACLVSLTILLFLRDWRTMIMASISIPVSIIGTFFLMYLFGFTFNNITMLALVMAVGLVIDDAIVVHENIFRWMEEKGFSAWDAALGATKEIGMAVMATTFSLVVIFLPVAFMSGMAGRFIRSFGITMAVAIMVSLCVSFTLTPMLCSRFLRLSKKAKAAIARGEHSHHSGGAYGWIAEKPYLFLLRWSLKHRWVVVCSALVVIVAMFPQPFGKWIARGDQAKAAQLAWANYPGVASLLGVDFLPPDDQGEWEVAITTPSGWTLEHTREQMEQIKDRLAKLPGVRHTLITIGDTSGKQTRATGDVTKGSVYCRMLDIDERPASLVDPKTHAPVTQFTNMAATREILRDYTDSARQRAAAGDRSPPAPAPTPMSSSPSPAPTLSCSTRWCRQHPRPAAPGARPRRTSTPPLPDRNPGDCASIIDRPRARRARPGRSATSPGRCKSLVGGQVDQRLQGQLQRRAVRRVAARGDKSDRSTQRDDLPTPPSWSPTKPAW